MNEIKVNPCEHETNPNQCEQMNPVDDPLGPAARLVSHITRAIVSSPEEVRVYENSTQWETIIALEVASVDRGRIIGKKGRTIRAVRELAQKVRGSYQSACQVRVLDGHGPAEVVQRPRLPNECGESSGGEMASMIATPGSFRQIPKGRGSEIVPEVGGHSL